MRTLYLVRHAKAEPHSLSKSDFYRNLMSNGIERARRIADHLQAMIHIDKKTLAITSPANRAVQTADIFCEALHYPVTSLTQDNSIYEAHFMDLLGVINRVPESYERLLLFGHNPGLSALVNYLSHADIRLATSNVAIIQFEDDLAFSMVSGGTGQLVDVLA
ncbi:MAG TPA: histidine phosphatase family protein [Candidatus Sphingobacterium stercorigallinarum]|nr:histidine phosphatase family protein [Candidatus Sphingobacterium stercorigallinarum]